MSFDGKMYWSSSVRWNTLDKRLNIEIFQYDNEYCKLFPEFYFWTQDGISKEELLKKFNLFNKKKLQIFIDDLIKKRILVSSLLIPSEIFYPQGIYLKDSYNEKLLIDAEKLDAFKIKELNRSTRRNGSKRIKLWSNNELPEYIINRRSQRKFNTLKKMSFEDFSYLAQVYKQKREDNKIFYNYASAGGLYPIDVYYYIKKDRVENIDEGLYYYDPVNDELRLVNEKINYFEECHYYSNKDIFLESAYSIIYVYSAESSFPKYGSNAYYYAMLDLGIMIETYTVMAETKDAGVCSIGEINFEKIEKYFNLKDTEIYLHTMEVGLK